MHAGAPDQHSTQQPHHKQDATKDLFQQSSLDAAVERLLIASTQRRNTLDEQSDSCNHTNDDERDGNVATEVGSTRAAARRR